jgi:hypothetical protein
MTFAPALLFGGQKFGIRKTGADHGEVIARSSGGLPPDRPHVDILVRDVFEQGDKIDFLLIIAANRGACLLTNDRYYSRSLF